MEVQTNFQEPSERWPKGQIEAAALSSMMKLMSDSVWEKGLTVAESHSVLQFILHKTDYFLV